MPHQRYVADVALEIDPATGLLVYRTVIVVINRQQGKTELTLPVMVQRAVGFGAAEPQEIRYAAQDGIEARRKWLDVHVPRLETSPIYGPQIANIRRRTSVEAIKWRNDSILAPIAGGTRKSGTSDSIDLAMVDEAWVHDDTRIEQGLRPTLLTRPQPQLWIVSMVPGPTRAKTTKSSFLRTKMALGRRLVEQDVRHGTCYFEWSAARKLNGKRTDPGDPATWLSCMPALCPDGPPCRCDPDGHWAHTVFMSAVQEDWDHLPLLDFTAEYLSWWPDETSTGWQVITKDEWEAAERAKAKMRAPLALCAWVTPDRSWAAIAMAGRRDGGGRLVEITGSRHAVDHRRGTGWVLPRLAQLDERHEPVALVTNDRTLADQASDHNLKLHRMQAGDEASAAGMLFDGIAGAAAEGRDVRHIGQRAFTAAMAAVAKRSQGQWWVWDQAEDDVDIAPVPAASGALWALMTPRVHIERPKPAGRPRVRWM